MISCINCGSNEETTASFCSHCGYNFVDNDTNEEYTEIKIIPFEKTKYHPDYKKKSDKIFNYPFDYGFKSTHTKFLNYVIAVDWIFILIIGIYSFIFFIFSLLMGFFIGGIGQSFFYLFGIILGWLYLGNIREIAQYSNAGRRDNIVLVLFTILFLLIDFSDYFFGSFFSIFSFSIPLLILTPFQLYGLIFHKSTLELFNNNQIDT